MKKLLSLLLILCAFGCKKYVVSFEQPTNMKLDKLKLEVLLDKKKVQEINLKATTAMLSYETVALSTSGEGKHLLQVKVKDTIFSYDIKYPEEKYILLTAHLKENGKIHIGILKQQYKFRLR
ncbi:hypothetical protein SAMN05444397_102383 [Flavobacterium aquidurense]|uniref:Lipoprotein n=1 Tax=Flavobacterium frigidimaris TaxID=262320 RepID=A0ABX4BQI0_FLAFR|nr:hypothetical protein [Flavobacterium frigidimaris]OXA79141.1 hypothetical protein B0A65_11380 [Flavobacterium frigidimaris]SDY83725.1 hypothetical protein SAMN05444397_102383 [Flavobacterium aquidurense]